MLFCFFHSSIRVRIGGKVKNIISTKQDECISPAPDPLPNSFLYHGDMEPQSFFIKRPSLSPPLRLSVVFSLPLSASPSLRGFFLSLSPSLPLSLSPPLRLSVVFSLPLSVCWNGYWRVLV